MCHQLAERVGRIPERFDAENKSTACLLKDVGFPARGAMTSQWNKSKMCCGVHPDIRINGCGAAAINDLPAAGASNMKRMLIVFGAFPMAIAKSNMTAFTPVRYSYSAT